MRLPLDTSSADVVRCKPVIDDELTRLDFDERCVGLVPLPGSGRMVWWTGRVAIGLRHQPAAGEVADAESWIRRLMLDA